MYACVFAWTIVPLAFVISVLNIRPIKVVSPLVWILI